MLDGFEPEHVLLVLLHPVVLEELNQLCYLSIPIQEEQVRHRQFYKVVLVVPH